MWDAYVRVSRVVVVVVAPAVVVMWSCRLRDTATSGCSLGRKGRGPGDHYNDQNRITKQLLKPTEAGKLAEEAGPEQQEQEGDEDSDKANSYLSNVCRVDTLPYFAGCSCTTGSAAAALYSIFFRTTPVNVSPPGSTVVVDRRQQQQLVRLWDPGVWGGFSDW